MQRTVYGEVGNGHESDARALKHRRYTDFTRSFKKPCATNDAALVRAPNEKRATISSQRVESLTFEPKPA
jgi:hypothetical protein